MSDMQQVWREIKYQYIYKILVRKHEEATYKTMHRWEAVKMDFKKINGTNWIQLTQDTVQQLALVNKVVTKQVPSKTGNFSDHLRN